jgi:hypothetical protein
VAKDKRVVTRMILPVALTLILSTQLAVAQSTVPQTNDYPSEQTVNVPGYPAIILPATPPTSDTFDNRLQTCTQVGTEVNSGPNLGLFATQCADQN